MKQNVSRNNFNYLSCCSSSNYKITRAQKMSFRMFYFFPLRYGTCHVRSIVSYYWFHYSVNLIQKRDKTDLYLCSITAANADAIFIKQLFFKTSIAILWLVFNLVSMLFPMLNVGTWTGMLLKKEMWWSWNFWMKKVALFFWGGGVLLNLWNWF